MPHFVAWVERTHPKTKRYGITRSPIDKDKYQLFTEDGSEAAATKKYNALCQQETKNGIEIYTVQMGQLLKSTEAHHMDEEDTLPEAPTGPFKLAVIFSREANFYAQEKGWDKIKNGSKKLKHPDHEDYIRLGHDYVVLTFATKDLRAAYIKGLEDGNGWDEPGWESFT